LKNPTHRKCSGKCKEILPLTVEHFCTRGKWPDGETRFTADCKKCRRVAHKDYRRRHPEKFNTNPDLRKLDQEKYKDHYRTYWKEWTKQRAKDNIQHRLRRNLRGRIWHALNDNKKSDNTIKLLGCTIQELKVHLEKRFTEGMNWSNYGKKGWEIDHIRPCASFDLTNENEQLECFNYNNLQPLWQPENAKKGSKYAKDINTAEPFF
jgi:hypothetical protein